MTRVLLLDFGEVVSRPFPELYFEEMARLLDLPSVHPGYWQHRAAYDGGGDTAAYWTAVAGHPLDDATVERLATLDAGGWIRPDGAALVAISDAWAAGLRLALLSNMPHPVADRLDDQTWTGMFEEIFLSARLGLAKPDPAIFRHALARLAVSPPDVTFLDDRAENVDAAASLGIDARLCRGPAALTAIVAGLLSA